ncbi:SCO2322 family protein [Streptomyces sp. TR02-1]|uniref:SCO2322 family protein n=1 Tax=Streptomyces sp. TR02-1 TaxID=3385977 RepID=UPI0039A24CEA
MRGRLPTGPHRSTAPGTGRVLAGAVLAAVLAVLCAAPAQATGYRYWSVWERDSGSWRYATQGIATLRPVDGDVLGLRFSVSEDSGDGAKPRGETEFAAICGSTEPRGGTKRIALSIDPGTAADAPQGERPPERRTACARVDEDATAGEALATVVEPLRYDSSAMLCALAGYPEKGCGEQVSSNKKPDGAATPNTSGGDTESPDDEGSGAGVAAGIAAFVAVAGAATWQARRRRP